MTAETLDTILTDPLLQAALASKYWSPQDAERILAALAHSGLSPRRFAERTGIGYRRLYDRMQRMPKAQRDSLAPPASSSPQTPAPAAPACAQAPLPPQFVALSVDPSAAADSFSKAQPLGLKIRFYRPSPETAEQLVMELLIPLW